MRLTYATYGIGHALLAIYCNEKELTSFTIERPFWEPIPFRGLGGKKAARRLDSILFLDKSFPYMVYFLYGQNSTNTTSSDS